MSGSFSQGVGQWIGAAEVYDAQGRFIGTGRDTRTVEANHADGRVTVNVTFDGPFRLSGVYTIADHTTHRVYEGPLNHGYAEALGDGLIAAHNYWPDLGLSQRFFLMVLPDGTRQLSLALIGRGEQLHYVVVGEYQRQLSLDHPEPPPAVPMDPAQLSDDPAAGRDAILLHRAGTWSGELTVLGGALEAAGTTAYAETVAADDGGLEVSVSNPGYGPDAQFRLETDGWGGWTPAGSLVGSYNLSGGRALSGQFQQPDVGLRAWRREVAALDGTLKGVLHTWYRGEQRVGVTYGVLEFSPT